MLSVYKLFNVIATGFRRAKAHLQYVAKNFLFM